MARSKPKVAVAMEVDAAADQALVLTVLQRTPIHSSIHFRCFEAPFLC